MKEFSIPMALTDFIPVILFLLATSIIRKDLKGRIRNISMLLFLVGAGMVFVAGALKASYKLLYALNVGDFTWMSNQFFSNQAVGFFLAGLGLVTGVTGKREGKAYAILPTMALVGIMVVGLGMMDAALCYVASRLKKKNALACFIVSFFLCLAMGYLSSKDFDKAAMNWIAQGINICGQGLLFAGCKILDKNGFNQY